MGSSMSVFQGRVRQLVSVDQMLQSEESNGVGVCRSWSKRETNEKGQFWALRFERPNVPRMGGIREAWEACIPQNLGAISPLGDPGVWLLVLVSH